MPPHIYRTNAALILGVVLVLIALSLNEWTLAALLNPGGGRITNPLTRGMVLASEIVLVTSGILLARNSERIRGRDLVLATVPTLVLLLGAEGVTRIIFRGGWENTMELDSVRGWVTRANLRKQIATPHGIAHYAAGHDGFRRWGNPNTRKIKILALGDSFTHAIGVSEGATYFDYLAAHDSAVEVFAYGSSMYGSLQEYLTLDKYLEVIKPDLILWQFCSNDIANNDRLFERASISNNNAMLRPYLENGRIERHFPYRVELVGRSYLLRYFEVQWRVLRRVRFHERSLEDTITPGAPLYREAVTHTSEIMRMVRRRAGHIPVIAFEVDRPAFINHTYAAVTRQSGIVFVDSIPELIESARRAGVRVDDLPFDNHWTAEGHRIAGEKLLDFLTTNKLIPRASTRASAAIHGAIGRAPTGS